MLQGKKDRRTRGRSKPQTPSATVIERLGGLAIADHPGAEAVRSAAVQPQLLFTSPGFHSIGIR
jgi:hypothetical protein